MITEFKFDALCLVLKHVFFFMPIKCVPTVRLSRGVETPVQWDDCSMGFNTKLITRTVA